MGRWEPEAFRDPGQEFLSAFDGDRRLFTLKRTKFINHSVVNSPQQRGLIAMTGAVPYRDFRELINFLPRAHPVRVMVCMLALTGCRLAELDLMRCQDLQGNTIYWRLGKNQTRHWRSEPLPAWYLAELGAYVTTHRTAGDHLFGPAAYTLRRYFNRDIRPHLGSRWNAKRPFKGFLREDPYVLQLKGFRKSFATTVFWREYQHWHDAHAGLLFAAKRLKHSTERITAMHYLQHVEHIDVELWDQFLSAEIHLEEQRRLADYEVPCRIRG